MQKNILILSLLIAFSISCGYSQNRSIQFHEKPWAEIVAMAKKENKMIFLDAYASWCGPCKWMAANMFTNDTIADYYNKTFICASIDMEKGEGLSLRKKYGVKAYPSLIFINTDENMVHEKVGAAQKVKDYINMAKVAQDPEICLSACLKKYQEGNNSPEFIAVYLARLMDAYIQPGPVMKKYYQTQSESDLLNRNNWNIICRFVTDMNDPFFTFLLRHREEYARLYPSDSVRNKISEVYTYALRGAQRYGSVKLTDTSYLSLKNKILASGFEGAGKVIFSSEIQYLQDRGKNEEFLEYVFNNLEKYFMEDYSTLSGVASMVASKTAEQKYLDKALSWSKRSLELKEEPFNLDNYASVLFKSGNTKEAIKQEKKAIALARKKNLPDTSYTAALTKMEASK